jgi:hypothetical protein
LVHTIKRAHSSGQMLASRYARGKNGIRRTITKYLMMAALNLVECVAFVGSTNSP